MSPLNNLPQDLKIVILQLLDEKSLLKTRTLSTHFNTLSNEVLFFRSNDTAVAYQQALLQMNMQSSLKINSAVVAESLKFPQLKTMDRLQRALMILLGSQPIPAKSMLPLIEDLLKTLDDCRFDKQFWEDKQIAFVCLLALQNFLTESQSKKFNTWVSNKLNSTQSFLKSSPNSKIAHVKKEVFKLLLYAISFLNQKLLYPLLIQFAYKAENKGNQQLFLILDKLKHEQLIPVCEDLYISINSAIYKPSNELFLLKNIATRLPKDLIDKFFNNAFKMLEKHNLYFSLSIIETILVTLTLQQQAQVITLILERLKSKILERVKSKAKNISDHISDQELGVLRQFHSAAFATHSATMVQILLETQEQSVFFSLINKVVPYIDTLQAEYLLDHAISISRLNDDTNQKRFLHTLLKLMPKLNSQKIKRLILNAFSEFTSNNLVNCNSTLIELTIFKLGIDHLDQPMIHSLLPKIFKCMTLDVTAEFANQLLTQLLTLKKCTLLEFEKFGFNDLPAHTTRNITRYANLYDELSAQNLAPTTSRYTL